VEVSLPLALRPLSKLLRYLQPPESLWLIPA